MTLGRTSSGAIKIKTDGGLRAVSCGCCGGGCPCRSALISGELVSILQNATTATCNGVDPSYWYSDATSFSAGWYIPDGDIFAVASWDWGPFAAPGYQKCMLVQADNGWSTLYPGPVECGIDQYVFPSVFAVNGIAFEAHIGSFFSDKPLVPSIFFDFY